VIAAIASTAMGQECTPPPNETCEGEIVFTSAELPYSVTAPLGCFNDVIDKPYFDIFYRYDCTQSGIHTISMCDSSGDTYLRIYTGACGWSGGTELATADDECPGSPPNADPTLSIQLDAGTTYWIELGTWREVPPWAPPPNSPYNFNVSIEGMPQSTSCDGTNIPTVLVGASGNPADGSGHGAVAYVYRLAAVEVTNRSYADFLNSAALDDPNGLYSEDMTDSDRGGIIRGGSPGSYVHWIKQSFGDKPVNFVSWLDAARYCNWLHNGRPIGSQGPATTEAGAYDLSLAPGNVTREPGARWFLPDNDEWYKAAYYDPFDPGADGGGTPDYWLYPTRSDTMPTQATANEVGDVTNPGPNVANYGGGADWNGENGNVTTVGSATATSPWGAFDMGGNVYEMTETLDSPTARVALGGDFSNAGILMSSGFSIPVGMLIEAANTGFRVAAIICRGDLDGDNDVDPDDYAGFAECLFGPDVTPDPPLPPPTPQECQSVFDFEPDGDVDLGDVAAFQEKYTG
jgi:formylglycine-generating enzyme required for sulfatase activity